MNEKLFFDGQAIRGIDVYCRHAGNHRKCVDCWLHHLHTISGMVLICHDYESYPEKYVEEERKAKEALKQGKYIKHSDGEIETIQLINE